MKSVILYLADCILLYIGSIFSKICSLNFTNIVPFSKSENIVPSTKSHLVLLQLDQIGDFIIFTDTLKIIRNIYPNEDWKITLIGFEDWRNLVEPFYNIQNDRLIDEFISVNMKNMQNNYKYRFATLKKITNIESDLLLNPNIARTTIMDEIVMLSKSKTKIGFKKINETRFSRYADLHYSQLIEAKNPIPHEIMVYRDYFVKLGFKLNDTLSMSLKWYKEDIDKVDHEVDTDQNFIIISPISGNLHKDWPIEKFNELTSKLVADGNRVYLSGSDEQNSRIEFEMSAVIKEGAFNVAGLFSLRQTAYLISKSALVIGTDSMAVHMSVATDSKSVCILPGMEYGRFFPYPIMKNSTIHKVIALDWDCFGCGWKCKYKINKDQPFPCLKEISVNSVVDATNICLN
jgi:ADP-heptose:LPS heptosyltransferase